MAKKTIASNADLAGESDVRPADLAVKFISDFPEYNFVIRSIDENGNPATHTDADGNNKLPTVETYSFHKVAGHRNAKTGKVDPDTQFSFFIVDPAIHGKQFKAILATLQALCKNPVNKMYTEDDHFKHRNPEAYKIAKEKVEMEGTIEEQAKKIEELERKLGLPRKS